MSLQSRIFREEVHRFARSCDDLFLLQTLPRHPSQFLRGEGTTPRGGLPLKRHHARFIPCLAFGFSLVLLFACLTCFAQTVSPITSSGLNTRVSPPSTLPSGKVQYDITGGTRPGGGANLFHSFGEFGVPNNNIANFLNDSGLATSNILGRVTGGNISNIFGAIQTQDSGARTSS